MSLREKLLADKCRRREVNLPGLPKLFVREMTGRERHEYELSTERARNEDGIIESVYPIKIKLVQLVTDDEDFAQVFKPDDTVEIEKIPARIIDAIFIEAAIVSGLVAEKAASDEENEHEELSDDDDEPAEKTEVESKNVIGAAGETS